MNPTRGYYCLIQYSPDPSRLEAANVGVVLFCPKSASWPPGADSETSPPEAEVRNIDITTPARTWGRVKRLLWPFLWPSSLASCGLPTLPARKPVAKTPVLLYDP